MIETLLPPSARRNAMLGYLLLFLVIPVGFALGGEAASFANIGLSTYVPLLLIATLAYLGERYPVAKGLTVAWVLLLFLALTLVLAGVTIISMVGISSEELTNPDAAARIVARLGPVLGLSLIGVLIACLGFIPGVRRALSRLLPLDPTSFVHTIALVSVTGISILACVPLIITGHPPLLSDAMLDLVAQNNTNELSMLLSLTVYSLAWSVPAAVFAVGYGLRRTFPDALQRLGLVRPTWRQIAIGVGVGILLVFVSTFLQAGVNWLWEQMGWPLTDAEAFNELLAFAYTPLGAILVGISAGVGEELAVRGVLQPRLGIFVSNLFFASAHALQYNWDALNRHHRLGHDLWHSAQIYQHLHQRHRPRTL